MNKDDSTQKLLRVLKKCLGNSFNKRTQFKDDPPTIVRILEEWNLDTTDTEINGGIIISPPVEGVRPPRGRIISKEVIEIVVEVPTDGDYTIHIPKIITGIKKYSIGKEQQGDVEDRGKEFVFKCNLKAKGNWITLHM